MTDRSGDTAEGVGRPAAVILTVLIPFGCGYYLSYLFRTVNAVISPQLVGEFGLTPADLGFLTSVYFVTFGSVQIPLGVVLDRYGPRRVQTALLVVAALGAAVFAAAESFLWLTVGRGLIGLGVSACLMASFKANALWWPRARLPLINNITMTFGSFGALSATVPVEALLHFTGWRELFAGLAVVTVLLAVMTYFIVPERRAGDGETATLREQFAALPAIYGSAEFWRLAAPVVIGYGVFLSYQTLWAAPWLRDIARFDRAGVADHLMLIQIGMFSGVLLSGIAADRLRKAGIGPERVVVATFAVAIVFQASIVAGGPSYAALRWGGYALFISATVLAFAILTERFPAELTGRVITGANLMIFVIAFPLQWGIGGIIGLFPAAPGGFYPPAAHTTALSIAVALQAVVFIFVVWPRRKAP